MKAKYILRGLGIGIILTTLILTIAFTAQKSTEELENRGKEETTVEPITESIEAETVEEETTTAQQATETTADENNAEAQNQETTAAGQNTPKSVTFSVVTGMVSEQVTDILYNAGVIDSVENFNKYLYDNGFSTLIRAGTFTITEGMSYLQIANKLCGF